MLEIIVPGVEEWDESKEEFVTSEPPVTLKLEHSLLSLAKWESKHHKPYLSSDPKTKEEEMDYIRCMTLNQNVKPEVYGRLTVDNIMDIKQYINDEATATKFYDLGNPKANVKKSPAWAKKVQTSEVIYALMFECNIPLEFEKRHLNHLMTLIKVCQERLNPSKSMSKSDRAKWQREQNAARLKRLGTKG